MNDTILRRDVRTRFVKPRVGQVTIDVPKEPAVRCDGSTTKRFNLVGSNNLAEAEALLIRVAAASQAFEIGTGKPLTRTVSDRGHESLVIEFNRVANAVVCPAQPLLIALTTNDVLFQNRVQDRNRVAVAKLSRDVHNAGKSGRFT